MNSNNHQLVDGENNAITCHEAVAVRDDIPGMVASLYRRHGDALRIVPVSAGSGGGGIFQQSPAAGNHVVALQINPAGTPAIRKANGVDLLEVGLHEILVDADAGLVYAGAGITLEQLNQAVADTMGTSYRVLGADLTSYTYAQVGATFMTGGMGPQRRYFSDSVEAIALFDGQKMATVNGSRLAAYAGSYGWTGIACAVCCRISRLPREEVAFAMPVSNRADDLSRLLAHFAPLCFAGEGTDDLSQGDVILGIEHITSDAMMPLFNQDIENDITRRARGLKQKCDAAEVDGAVFITGFCNDSAEAFLERLLDSVDDETLSIAGVDLEHTEIFNDAELMRGVREAVPFAARTQSPRGRFVYKGHTDANIRLNPERVAQATKALWQANETYVEAVASLFRASPGVKGEILVYGHLNPYGVDPHNRVTLAGDNEVEFNRVIQDVEGLRDDFFQQLCRLCGETGSVLIGGEKGAASEAEIINALGGVQAAPAHLRQKAMARVEVIREASEMFNWRAILPVMG